MSKGVSKKVFFTGVVLAATGAFFGVFFMASSQTIVDNLSVWVTGNLTQGDATTTISSLSRATDSFEVRGQGYANPIFAMNPITRYTAHLDGIPANGCDEEIVIVNGVTQYGASAVLLTPSATLASASSTITYQGWVSNDDIVTVRACQIAGTAAMTEGDIHIIVFDVFDGGGGV